MKGVVQVKSLLRLLGGAIVVAGIVFSTSGVASASQWNPITQTLNSTNWTQENYVRTVTTPNADINLRFHNKPGCCLDMRLRSASSGAIFAEEYNMRTLNQVYVIATNVLPGTRFNVEARNSVPGTDRWWQGELYY
nr:hypothetical protein [Micromonospora sp. DSM 115978]